MRFSAIICLWKNLVVWRIEAEISENSKSIKKIFFWSNINKQNKKQLNTKKELKIKELEASINNKDRNKNRNILEIYIRLNVVYCALILKILF